MSSRDIKEKEVEAAKKNGVTPNRVVVAIDAIVPVVNPANPVAALTTAQLRDIYAGKITNWKEIGGQDGKIVVISRDTSSGTFECWQELIMISRPIKEGFSGVGRHWAMSISSAIAVTITLVIISVFLLLT